MPPTTIPARSSALIPLLPHQLLKLVNPSGTQVIDLWCFPTHQRTPTWLSTSQTRSKIMRLIPQAGDELLDTHRCPILRVCEDSSSARGADSVHDMLFPACDSWRYAELGMPEHGSCGANLREQLAAYVRDKGHDDAAIVELEECIRRWGWMPEPLNVFMNVPWEGREGRLEVRRPRCEAGDFVVLKAMVECVVVISACPNDVLDTNGGTPGPIAYEVLQ